MLRARPLSCQELVELVTDYSEDALSRRDRRRFEAHIAGCDGCTRYLDQMRATIGATDRLEAESISPQARDELLAAFSDWRGAQPA